MSLLTLLIAIIIAGGLSYGVKVSPLGQPWRALAYLAIGLFFIVWLYRYLKAGWVDLTI